MSIRQKEIKSVLNRIEEEFPVTQWKHRDVEIWPFLRVKLWAILSNQSLNISEGTSILSVSKFDKYKRLIKGPFRWVYHSFKDFSKSYFRIPDADVFVLGDGISFTKIQDRYFDKFSDSMALLLERYDLSLVRVDSSNTFYKPRFSSSYFIQPMLDFILAKSIISAKIKKTGYNLPGLDGVKTIAEEFGLGYLFEESSIHLEVRKIECLAKYFQKCLSRGKFRAAMSICYYTEYGFAMNLACSRIGIPSYDIQHGVQGDSHGAYGAWNNVPREGYNLLPNYFLSWSSLEKTSFEKWSKKLHQHDCIVTGNLLINLWQSDKYEWSSGFEKVLNDKINSSLSRILVTLSWDVSSKEFIGSTLEVIANTQNEFNWLIRLHPSMMDEKSVVQEMLANSDIHNYELDVSSELPLYTILSNIDLHITHSSSTAIEASYFGVNSIVTSDYGWTLLSGQLESEYINLGITADQISDLIRTQFDNSNRQVDKQLMGRNSNPLDKVISTFKK